MHSARSTGQPSLHVTLGLTAFTWAEFLVESVTAAALEEESLRRNLPREFARGGFPVAERERLFGEKLAFVQSRFNPQAVWRRFTPLVHVPASRRRSTRQGAALLRRCAESGSASRMATKMARAI